jgi:hypothetical protein
MTEAEQQTGQPERTPIEKRRANYNRVVRQARLLSLLLEDLKFNIDPSALEFRREMKRSIGSEIKNFAFVPDQNFCAATIQWSIEMRHRRRKLVKCVAAYTVLYENIKECEEDVVRIFMDNVGKAATYAYLRSLFAQLDWASNLNSPPLPVLRLEPSV